MRVEIEVLMKKRDAYDGDFKPDVRDIKIRRTTYYPDGKYFKHEYLSFLTGAWIESTHTLIPAQCMYDDDLRTIMNADDKRPRTLMATIVDGERRYIGPIPRESLIEGRFPGTLG